MLEAFDDVINLFVEDRKTFRAIARRAGKERFTWKDSVNKYYTQLYDLPLTLPIVKDVTKEVSKVS